MASNVEVAGISIGITADVSGLQASLNTSKTKVDNWVRSVKDRKVAVTVEAKKGDSWGTLERDLNALVERVTKGYAVPVNVELDLPDPKAERTRLEGIIKGTLGSLKVPLDIDYKAKAHVEVTWSWADGSGPPTHVQAGPGTGTPQKSTVSRGRRTATGDDEVVTPSSTAAPTGTTPPPAQRGGRKTPTTTSTVRAKPAPQVQPEPTPEEVKTGGIAAMPTATPKNRAQKAAEQKIAENTAAQGEAAQAAHNAAREWREVTRATAMAHARREIPGMAPISTRIPRGAVGFESEYAQGAPTGNIRYRTAEGQTVSQLRSRAPTTFGMERRREGRTYMAYRGDPEDPRRGLSDPRTMAWFDPGGGFDSEVTRHSRALFNEEMARREEEVFKKLEPVFAERARRPDEDEAAYRARLANTYTVSAWGKQVPMSAENILASKTRIADVAKLPEIQELEKYRIEGKYDRFFGDPVEAVMSGEGTQGALHMRAEAMQAIRLQSVLRATQAKGAELTEQERKAALSKGTQRARRLRNEGAGALPKTPEEALYLTLNAMIGNAFAEQEAAEQRLRQEQATEQSQASLGHNEAAAAFVQMRGERPARPQDVGLIKVPAVSGETREVWDIDKGLVTPEDVKRDPSLKLGERHMKRVPLMVEQQATPGRIIERLKDEAEEEYDQRVADLQEDWDAEFRDFEREFTAPRPGAGRAARPRARQKVSATGADVGLTPKQQDIEAMRERMEQLEAMEQFGEEGFDPDELADLQNKLADIAAGGLAGSARQQPWERRMAARRMLARELEGYANRTGDLPEELLPSGWSATRGNKGWSVIPPMEPEFEAEVLETIKRQKRRATDLEGLVGSARVPLQLRSPNRGMVDPRRLVGHRELNRETYPRVRGDYGYLDELTEQIAREGIQEPLTLLYGDEGIHKEEAYPRLSDGNHRLAAALRLGLPEVPVRTMRRTGDWSQTQGDLSPDEVLRLFGSARTRRSDLEALGGTPIEVPDVRDIAAAMGLGRGGFGTSGIRTKMPPGSRQKMQRVAKGAEVEKAWALVGDRYVDATGRVLNDIREVIELEVDPAKTSRYGFAVSGKGVAKLRQRLETTGQGLLGLAHSHMEGLKLSEPGAAAVPGQDDASALQALNEVLPGFLSAIVNPSTREGMRMYGVGPEGITRRAVNLAGNIPRMVNQPETAQAATPTVQENLERLFDQLPPDEKSRMVAEWDPALGPMPPAWQTWATQQAQGQAPTGPMVQAEMWDPASLAGQPTSPFRWRMGAEGIGTTTPMPGPAIMPGGYTAPPPPPRGAAAAAAMGPGFFGGGAPPPTVPGATPSGPGGFQPGQRVTPGTVSQFQRSVRSVREEALQAGVPYNVLQGVESGYESEYLATMQTADAIAGQIQEDIGKTPVRAFTTAIGQYASQLLVRGEVGERRIQAQTLGRMYRSAGRERMEAGLTRDLLQERLAEGRREGTLTPEQERDLEGQIGFQEERFKGAESAVDFFGEKYREAAKGVAPLGVQIANLATITGSMMLAGVAFQVGMQAASAAMDAFMQVTYDGVEAATGYNATLKRVQEALAKQALETGGVRGAVAGGFAAAGMEPTPEQRSLLEGQVGAVTATNRFVQQRDMLRTLENLRSSAPGAAQFGIAPGLVRPTGGLFGTVIGAQPSLDEMIGNELERLSPGGLAGLFNAGWERAPFTGSPFDGTFELFGLTEAGKQREKAQLDFAESLNRELEQVGNTARVGVGDAFFRTPERLEQAAALDAIGANEIAAAVRDGAYEIRDANGEIVTSQEELAGIVKDLGEALQLPSGREAYRAGARQRNAAMMGIEFGFQNQTNIVNPISNWRRLAVQRPLAFGTGWAGTDAASQAAMAAFGPGAQDSMATLNRAMAQGRQQALDLGVDPGDIRMLESFGTQIRSIQTDLADRRLAVSTAAYNQQLMVAKRNLSDLAGLTGQVAEHEASALGIREQQNLALSRENTRLGREIQARSLDMAQRQLNLSVATAGFALAGETGAERAARREAAERDAALKQMDIDAQREMFANEGQIIQNTILNVDEQNLRAFQDAVFAVQQIERERDLEKYSAAAEQFMGLLQQEADMLGAEIDAQITRGMNYVTLAQEEIRRVYIESGEILTGVNEDIADSFKQIREDFDTWLGSIGDLVPLTPGGAPRKQPEEGTGSLRYGGAAGGALFNTSGPGTLLVGEAGDETVAVLRNPRLYTSAGGGSGVNLTLQFNGEINVREDEDINRIARVVEQMIQQRAGLLGMMRDR